MPGPPDQRLHDDVDDALDRRRRAIRWIATFMTPWMLLIGVGMFGMGERVAAVSVLSVAVGCLATLGLLRAERIPLAGHVLTISLAQCLWVLSVLLGGVSSPATQWWVLVPVLAMAASGVRAALGWTVAMVVGALVVHGIQAMGGVHEPTLMHFPGWETMGTGTSIALLALLFGYLWANDAQYQRLVDRLRSAEASEREANRAKSVFLANMSHELRTPLNAILGYAELLEEEADEAEQAEMVSDLRHVQRAGRHLLGLVNDVLDLSKIEAGRLVLTLEDVALHDVVQEALVEVRPLMAKRGNTVTIDVPPTTVHADRFRLHQCLLNILSNAAKFTEAGAIEVRWVDGALQVRDTGIGMTDEQLGRVFQPFTQAEDHTHRTYGGTGLGLTIVKRLMEEMGGGITIVSTEGEGTTVLLQIPLAE